MEKRDWILSLYLVSYHENCQLYWREVLQAQKGRLCETQDTDILVSMGRSRKENGAGVPGLYFCKENIL